MASRAPDLATIDTWVFDLDNTLYPAACNLFAQVDWRITHFLAGFLKMEKEEARRIQKELARRYGTSMRGMMVEHGMPPGEFLRYVHDIDVTPVQPSPALDQALARLPGRKLIYTNGSTRHAENVMSRLGVGHHFAGIFDIVASDYVPKPDPAPYRALIDRHAITAKRAVMIEDIARNLIPAAQLGMTTVWVRTDHDFARFGADAAHIHHETDDLVTWLEAAPTKPSAT
ncbi:MAG: pyrimidine 5'-nucleotidase [Alphaproteobacteria bacterium]|nr:pyrimidine 5'-nucleotidase [Alphaproteobacteria bacterium]